MSAVADMSLDMLLETEEFVTAEEYLRRASEGYIDPSRVRFVTHTPDGRDLGGFWIRLEKPRYKAGVISPVWEQNDVRA